MTNPKYLPAVLLIAAMSVASGNKPEYNITMHIGVSSISNDTLTDIEQRFDEIKALQLWSDYRAKNVKDNSVKDIMIKTRLGRLFVKKNDALGQKKSQATSEVYLLPYELGTNSEITITAEGFLAGTDVAPVVNGTALAPSTTDNFTTTDIAAITGVATKAIANRGWAIGFTGTTNTLWAVKPYRGVTNSDENANFSYHLMNGTVVNSNGATGTFCTAQTCGNSTFQDAENHDKVWLPYNIIQVSADTAEGLTFADPGFSKYVTAKVIGDGITSGTDEENGTNWPYFDYPAYLVSETDLEEIKQFRNNLSETTDPQVIELPNHHRYYSLDASAEARYHFDLMSLFFTVTGHYPVDAGSRDTTKLVTFTPTATFDACLGMLFPYPRANLSGAVGINTINGDLVYRRYSDEDGFTLKYINYDNTYSTKAKAEQSIPEFSESTLFIELKAESKADNSDEISYFSKYRKTFRNGITPTFDKISFKQDSISVGMIFTVA